MYSRINNASLKKKWCYIALKMQFTVICVFFLWEILLNILNMQIPDNTFHFVYSQSEMLVAGFFIYFEGDKKYPHTKHASQFINGILFINCYLLSSFDI